VNLLPFNEHPQSPFKRPDDDTLQKFRAVLMAHRFTTMVRLSKGADIMAACGQLGGKYPELGG
jgi:23S rRNA (adenine2503-C2)-methyltransferase